LVAHANCRRRSQWHAVFTAGFELDEALLCMRKGDWTLSLPGEVTSYGKASMAVQRERSRAANS
jgi:hypothetical protein